MVTGLAVSAPDQTGCQHETGHSCESEAGLIPADWEAVSVEDIATITTGSRNTQDRVRGGTYPFFVRSQNIERINSYSFEKEAVLTAGDGVGTGKIFHYIDGKFDVHQRVYVMSDFTEKISGYFFYLVFSSLFYDRIMQMTAKSSVDSVRREMIARMAIPLPPRREQDAIVEALKDAECLVLALEQLIEKKRLIKQGAMQELLSGHRRLPEFSGEWERKPILELVSLPTGQVDPRIEPYRSMPLVGPEHIEEATGKLSKPTTAAEQYAISGKYLFQRGDVIYGKINPHLRKVSLAPFDGVCSADLYPLHPRKDVSSEFITGVLLGEEFTKYATSLSARSGIPKINREELAGFFVAVPNDFQEQLAIAACISDMRAEIEFLETRLEKARQIKQGMMQELLTGRVRLV